MDQKSDSEKCSNRLQLDLIISPNEVFGVIMVLASPCPPRWREHSYSKNIQSIFFQILYVGKYP